MDHKQFISNVLNDFPQSNQSFQTNRYSKISLLNIPDTIPENCSEEISGCSPKMEASKIMLENFDYEDKENISNNLQVLCKESPNTSLSNALDNSYLRQCEKNLLESISSDEEKNIDSDKSIVNKQLKKLQRNVDTNDTISTPPSLLRKEISLLRNEMAEAHEFHDLEIQVLQEEKFLSDTNTNTYLELFEKYSALMDLYTTLKTEYEEYRKEQEKMRHELQSKTADCLESLCSQIETSDNSLNFSSASFVSFTGGIKSSTMMEDMSEVEATVVHDVTVLGNDPLYITADGEFKTPIQTPLRSAKKLFSEESNSTLSKPVVKEIEVIAKSDAIVPFNSEYNLKVLNLETALYDKVKEVENLEHRLFKMEDLSTVLQNEFERITSVYLKENNTLKDSLSKKTEQLNELTEKLFTEIVSLNPSLRDSLVDIRDTKLLVVFIETIMESCKKIQEEQLAKHNGEKAEWETWRKKDLTTIENLQIELEGLRKSREDLEKKLSDAENTILTRDEEILLLQSHLSNVRQTRENFAAARETLLELETRLTLAEAEKTAAENRFRELQSVVEDLKREIDANENIRFELQTQASKTENENIQLKKLCDSLTTEVAVLKSKELQMMNIIDKLSVADETIMQLQSKIQSVEAEKSAFESRCSELEETNKNLRNEIIKASNLEENPAYKDIQFEVDSLKQKISESEKVIAELERDLKLAKESQSSDAQKVDMLLQEIESLKAESSGLAKAFDMVEKTQNNVSNELSNAANNSDLSCEKITEIIKNSSKLESTLTRENKIISVFLQTITDTCKGVQNGLYKKFDVEKLEWQTQKDVNSNLIDRLQHEIKLLTENEAKFSETNLEKEELIKSLKNEIAEAEQLIAGCSEEITVLKSHEAAMKLMKDDLAAAEEIIFKLNSQLLSTQSEKNEMESRCKMLEEDAANFQSQIDTVNKELNEIKILRDEIETENGDLKQRIVDSEELIIGLNNSLEVAKEEQKFKEIRIKELEDEIAILKTEQESLLEKLRNLESSNENFISILSGIQAELEMPENTLTELISDNFNNKKIFIQKINSLIKTHDLKTENLLSLQETNRLELDESKKTCESLRENLTSAQNTISAREDEIRVLQSNLKQIQDDLTEVRNTLVDLVSRLSVSESEKTETEKRYRELETIVEDLKREIEVKESCREELKTQVLFIEEKKTETESENIQLKELCHNLQAQMTETETLVSQRDEEIIILKTADSVLRKTCESLEAKLLEAENSISTKEKEIQVLQSDMRLTQETLSNQLTFEKTVAEKRYKELEEIIENLKRDIDEMEKIREELNTQRLENAHIKDSYEGLKNKMAEAENVISTRDEEIRVLKAYESELTTFKENLVSADETIQKLQSQLKSIEVEKSQMESLCTELQENNQNLKVEIIEAKNLKNHPAYEKIQIENDDLKERIFESEKMMADLKTELEVAKADQMNNISKVQELISEIEELKRENSDFSHALVTIEETQRNLADVLSDAANDSDLPGDRITKVIEKTSKLPDARETKIVSDFVETITKTCKGVQNELIKKFDNKKLEWESQRDVDVRNLQNQINLLTERNGELEAVIKETKENLAAANETIFKLKSQLSSAETEKVEIELWCRKLEEDAKNLLAEIDTKETIIKGLDELKFVREKVETENSGLKQRILELEEIIIDLKKSLKDAEEEQNAKDAKIQNLLQEIESLKVEQQALDKLSEKLLNLEQSNKNLMEVVSDVQFHLDMPEDALTKLLSGNLENKKILSERINIYTQTQMEGLKAENRTLKIGNENLKEKVKQLVRLIGESANSELKEEVSNLNISGNMSFRSKSGRNMDICVRRLDKLEEINHNLTELLTHILTMTDYPDLGKLRFCSVRDFPNITKKVVAHVSGLESKLKELKEENGQLDEECETYAKIIKDLKKEAAAVWKANKEKTEALEAEISRLKEEKNHLENEKQNLTAKIQKLTNEYQTLKSASKTEGSLHNCVCGNESKKISELKRNILVKEQKILELQDLEVKSTSFKSQIEYLKTALYREKKKIGEEKEKNKKLQNELKEVTKNQKTEAKSPDENEILDELRMRGSVSGGIVQEFVDKEKMRKLSKDIGILKELCRARYSEIKRLEAVNAALRNTPKNSNQMDSPIRPRGYNTRSKNQLKDPWKPEIIGKENGAS